MENRQGVLVTMIGHLTTPLVTATAADNRHVLVGSSGRYWRNEEHADVDL